MTERIVVSLLLLTTFHASPVFSDVVFDNLDSAFDGGANLERDDDRAAQPFLIGDNNMVDSVTVRLQRFGRPEGTLSFELWDDASNRPSEPVAHLGSLDLNDVASGRFQNFRFDTPITDLTSNETYYVVMSGSDLDVDLANRVDWAATPDTAGTFGAGGLHGYHVPSAQWFPFQDWPDGGPPFPLFFGMRVSTGSSLALPGDFNADGILDAADIDALTAEVQIEEPNGTFDANNDLVIDHLDRLFWIHELVGTWIGDANLDGEFNSGDFIHVFQAAKYELDESAGWGEGDWNGDQRFDSGDFIAAFQDGGFELGPKSQVNKVPELTSTGWLLLVLCVALPRKRLLNR